MDELALKVSRQEHLSGRSGFWTTTALASRVISGSHEGRRRSSVDG